jgi:hypothetical protein
MLSASRQTPPPSGPSGPAAPKRNVPSGESEQERYRRFMEAVGLPKDSPPPAPIRPRGAAAPGPLLPVKPAPLYSDLAPGRARRVTPAQPPATVTPRARTVTRQAAPVSVAAPAKSVADAARPMQQIGPLPQNYSPPRPPAPAAPAGPAVRPSFPAGGLLLRLRDPAAIREAMILREILGPPKALQPVWPGPRATAP